LKIELKALRHHDMPRMVCNYSAQRVNCPDERRAGEGALKKQYQKVQNLTVQNT